MADITKLRLSGQTYNIKDESALHTLDASVTSGSTNAVAGGGVYDAIETALQSVADQHYQTSGDVQNAISGKADAASAVTDVRVTSDNGKKQLRYGIARNGTFGTDAVLATFNTGFTMYGNTVSIDTTVIAQKTDIPAVSGYADSVKYNSTSKYVEFYHGGTGGTKVFEYDASPFLIDGMVDNVEVKDVTLSGESVTCLVITFNTDAGKQEIDIPISEIFDASNYYTKTETDNKIDEKIAEAGGMTSGAVQSMIDSSISGKADTTAVTEALTAKTDTTAFTAHTADTTAHVTSAEKNTWNAKANVSDIPTSNSELTNDKKYVYLTLDGETLVFNT